MSSDVELRYCRVGLGHVGTVDGIGFDGVSFADMMMLVHGRLTTPENADAGLCIKRTERENLFPIQLEPRLLELLRKDPQEYIRVNSLPDRVVDLSGSNRTSKLAAKYEVPRGLRAGHDSLAAALGDCVYLRQKGANVESPETGRWVPTACLSECLNIATVEVVPPPIHGGLGWVIVSTQSLLDSGISMLYLPREWNRHGGWITRSELRKLYEQFVKDRAQCLSVLP